MMSLAMQRGLIYPANHGDTEYEQEKENLKNAEKIRAEDIPPLMAYALFTENGQWKEGTIPQKDAEKAWEVSHRGYTGLGRDFYRVVAVSYTHLDVYKRQIFCVSSPSATRLYPTFILSLA